MYGEPIRSQILSNSFASENGNCIRHESRATLRKKRIAYNYDLALLHVFMKILFSNNFLIKA